MDFRNKASNNAYLLLALLPIPKFMHPKKKICGILEARLFHECLDLILQPLKEAAKAGHLMLDPLGQQHWCFMPLASYIVDTPESALVSGVGCKTSSVTTAIYAQLGDDFHHPPRRVQKTLDLLAAIEKQFLIHGIWRNMDEKPNCTILMVSIILSGRTGQYQILVFF